MRKERAGPAGSLFDVHCTLNEKIFMKTGKESLDFGTFILTPSVVGISTKKER